MKNQQRYLAPFSMIEKFGDCNSLIKGNVCERNIHIWIHMHIWKLLLLIMILLCIIGKK